MKILFSAALFIISVFELHAQSVGKISGKVIDKISNQPLPGVNILVLDTQLGAATDLNGEFTIDNVEIGSYRVRASFVGYDPIVKSEVVVNSARPAVINFKMVESVIELEGVTVTSEFFENDPTEVNSIKSFSYEEIRRTPGGFEDVVRALSVLPGVAQADAGRNDLIVRGGAPSENLFIVDGFVVPNINHFGTQGATGGPLSYINLDYVSETSFSTGGFSAIYGDKLSSVLKINLREGRNDRLGGKALISATQFGLNLEGPVTDNSNFIFSARRSYLDFIFNAAGFNFVPEYWDVLAKYNYEIDNKNRISYLFVSAFDRVNFNNNDDEDIFDNARILGNNQNQYLTGVSYRHLFDDGFYKISLSRNFVDYESFQNDTLQQPIFKNNSREAENELKFDLVYKLSSTSELAAGVSGKYVKFETNVLFPINYITSFGDTLPITSVNTFEKFAKAAGYLQLSDVFWHRLRVNLGLRGDYFSGIEDKFYISPRFSTSYSLTEKTSVNFATGIYYQFPSYIWLVADKQNEKLKAVHVNQFIGGFEYTLFKDTRFKLEGFYKDYSNYPASTIRPYLVLANTGAGFGGSTDNFATFGLEPLVSRGTGNVRGFELSLQKKYSDTPHYGLISLTYSESNFESLDGIERPGEYDQRWIFNMTAGYIFNNKWEASIKFRFATGSPYTPFNNDGTQSVVDYLTERLDPAHSLDVRVDRRWDFNGWSLITYIDIQNIYNRKNTTSIRWDYREMKVDDESSIGILPSIGISLEF